ncbi:MAG: hypothetical protein LBU62_02485 [Bacteroidales bacterium]|jgi:hypothetical protein|nr:hypothetical protein [Bacteroidales bacterium]
MVATTLNPTQLHLLQMFSHLKDEQNLYELREVLHDYYCRKVEEESKLIWNEKGLSNEIMNEWLNTHIRTPYKQ